MDSVLDDESVMAPGLVQVEPAVSRMLVNPSGNRRVGCAVHPFNPHQFVRRIGAVQVGEIEPAEQEAGLGIQADIDGDIAGLRCRDGLTEGCAIGQTAAEGDRSLMISNQRIAMPVGLVTLAGDSGRAT